MEDNEQVFDKVSAGGYRYRELEVDGVKVREYESGAITNDETGKLISGPKKQRISTDNARHFHELRAKKAEQAAVDGMLKAAQMLENGVDTPDLAWSTVVGAQTMLALNPDSGRASTEAAKFIGRATGYLGDGRRGSLEISEGSRSLKIDGLPEGELLRMLARLGGDKNSYYSQDANQSPGPDTRTASQMPDVVNAEWED